MAKATSGASHVPVVDGPLRQSSASTADPMAGLSDLQVRDEERKRRSDRRARQSVFQSLHRIREAMECQLTVLNKAADGIRDAATEKDHKLAQLKLCNEANKLRALVGQLDGLTTRMRLDDVSAIGPAVHQIRKLADERLSNVSICNPLIEGLAADLSTGSVREDEPLTDALTLRGEENSFLQLQSQIADGRQMQQACTRLQTDLLDLNETFSTFSHFVTSQKETTDRIESNVMTARSRLYEGAVILSKIPKSGSLPLIGAAIGTVVAGPIGMFAGYKLAAVACLGTATAGYLGGKVVASRTTPLAISTGAEDVTIEALVDQETEHEIDDRP